MDPASARRGAAAGFPDDATHSRPTAPKGLDVQSGTMWSLGCGGGRMLPGDRGVLASPIVLRLCTTAGGRPQARSEYLLPYAARAAPVTRLTKSPLACV